MISVALGKIVGVLGNEARMVANKTCGVGKSNPPRLCERDVEVTLHCRTVFQFVPYQIGGSTLYALRPREVGKRGIKISSPNLAMNGM